MSCVKETVVCGFPHRKWDILYGVGGLEMREVRRRVASVCHVGESVCVCMCNVLMFVNVCSFKDIQTLH